MSKCFVPSYKQTIIFLILLIWCGILFSEVYCLCIEADSPGNSQLFCGKITTIGNSLSFARSARPRIKVENVQYYFRNWNGNSNVEQRMFQNDKQTTLRPKKYFVKYRWPFFFIFFKILFQHEMVWTGITLQTRSISCLRFTVLQLYKSLFL